MHAIESFNQEAFIKVHENKEPITSIRINPFKTPTNLSFEVDESVPWCTQGFYLQKRPSFIFDPLLHAGAYYVQEASSMFLQHILQTLNISSQSIALDVCAAPGGKTTILSSYLKDGLVVSNEIIANRQHILSENVTKWGIGNVVVANTETNAFKNLTNFFDIALIDAPCSGSGMFRKDETAVNQWSENLVNQCSTRQQKIVDDVIDAIKTDGYLIYSTCSYSLQENEAIVEYVLKNYPLKSVPISTKEEWTIVEVDTKSNGIGYRFYPYNVKGEGFFIAVFKKERDKEYVGKPKTKPLPLASKQEAKNIQLALQLNDGLAFIKLNELFIGASNAYLSSIEHLHQYIKIKKIGTALGSFKGNQLVPEHDYALSILPKNGFPIIDLNKDDALNYLTKKSFYTPNQLGWCIVSYASLPLGFIKVMPNRVNNYYPTNWRVLKELID